MLKAVAYKAARAAAAQQAVATETGAAAAAAPPPTPTQTIQAGYVLLFDVKAGTRSRLVGRLEQTTKGAWHTCKAPGCDHSPFFVSKKVNTLTLPWYSIHRLHLIHVFIVP